MEFTVTCRSQSEHLIAHFEFSIQVEHLSVIPEEIPISWNPGVYTAYLLKGYSGREGHLSYNRLDKGIAKWVEGVQWLRNAETGQFASFTVFCSRCNHTYLPESVYVTEWKLISGLLAARGGRAIYCYKRHLLHSGLECLS